MKLSKILLTFTLAFSGAMVSVPTAIASSSSNAVAKSTLNVRSGPSTRFNVVDTLYRGESVQTHACQQGWCYITHSGPDGWVASRYLRGVTTPNPTYEPPTQPSNPWPPRATPFPSVNPWPASQMPWPFQSWPSIPRITVQPSGPQNQACVYTGNHFTGLSTCVASGRSFEQLGPRWNNRISSIKVFTDASITLCRNNYFGGFCRTIDHDVRRLGQALNNKVSSLSVD